MYWASPANPQEGNGGPWKFPCAPYDSMRCLSRERHFRGHHRVTSLLASVTGSVSAPVAGATSPSPFSCITATGPPNRPLNAQSALLLFLALASVVHTAMLATAAALTTGARAWNTSTMAA